MYYFYAPEMFVPFHWGLERNVSYAYMPYHSFYYGNYIDAVPYVLNVPQNDQVKVKEENRGHGHLFHGLKNMRMHFQDHTIKRK